MERIQAVLFDFDYTLGDSTAAVVECVNFALREMGRQAADFDAVRKTIGLSLAETFCALAGRQNAEACREFTRLFVKRGDDVMVAGTTLYPDVREVIDALRGRSLSTGIVSTKYRYRIQAVLEREKMTDRFDVVVGGEDVEHHKPAPDALLLAMDKLQTSPAKTLYVGDSLIDAESAERAGVPFVAVTTGVTPARDFAGYRPVAVVTSLRELPGAADIPLQPPQGGCP